MNDKKSTNILNGVSIFFLFILSAGGMLLNPVIQKLIEAFPDTPVTTIRMVSTLPSFVAMISTLVAGASVGKKIGYKAMSIIGIILFTVGGMGPYLFHSTFTTILAFRLIFGIGLGIFGIRNALLIRTFGSEKSPKLMGYTSLISSIVGMLLQSLAGILADINWTLSFLVFGIGLIALVFAVLFLKNPDIDEAAASADTNAVKEKKTLDKKIYLFAILQFFITMALYPLLSGMSTYLVFKELGTAAVAGTILSLYTLGSAINGLLLGKMTKAFGKYMLAFTTVMMIVGMSLVLFINNLIVIGIGTTMCGFGFASFMISLQIITGRTANKASVSLATTFVLTFHQAAIFLSSYWIVLCGKVFGFIMPNEIMASFLAAILVCAIVFIIALIGKIYPEQQK